MAGRPSMSASVSSQKMSKEERNARIEQEQKLKGGTDKIIPGHYLNKRQRKIFNFIVDEMKASNILGNLDIYILSTCAIALDRIQTIEEMINKDITLLQDKTLLSTKDKYTKDFFKCCTELSLSPSSRAKLGNINAKAQEEAADPLLSILNGTY